MKSALALVFLSTFAFAFASHGIVHQHRCTGTSEHSTTQDISTNGGWGQYHSGNASFTEYSGCGSPSCGITLSGFSAAVNQFAFGAPSSSGDACGRCFKITGNTDPYTPSFTGPFNTIVVRVNDLCPIAGNGEWCGQSGSQPLNQHGTIMHFDLCEQSGSAGAFFPQGHDALLGTFEEVQCEGNWVGGEGGSLWNGSCMANDTTPLWPSRGCGDQGNPPQ